LAFRLHGRRPPVGRPGDVVDTATLKKSIPCEEEEEEEEEEEVATERIQFVLSVYRVYTVRFESAFKGV